jgi:PPP family 3-phenylpropionic acid transporter
MRSVPHRLAMALVWFFGLGAVGMFLPFFGLYLHENAGLPGTRVGGVLALLPLVGMAVQPLWGQLADRTGARSRVLVAVAAGSALGYAALYGAESFPTLVAATVLLAAFQTAFVPSAVSVTLALAREGGPHAFGLSRVWGTLGFLFFVVAFPTALHAVQRARGLAPAPGGPSEPGLELMFALAGAAVAVGALAALALPTRGAVGVRAPRGDWRRLAAHGPYLRVLAFSFAGYLCLQGPLTLFPVFVRARGGSLDSVSGMWVPMLLLEIPLVALSGQSLARVGARGLLAIGIAAGGVRWLVCGLSPGLAWVYPAQLLHGVAVAGFVLGAPLYAEAVVPERLRSTGQGILTMLGASLGGITSNLASGWLLERIGPDAPYVAGGVGALLLAALVPVALPPPDRPPPAADERDPSPRTALT